ncbi:MAG: ABC transporter permease, partial [Gaiellales bacterium]
MSPTIETEVEAATPSRRNGPRQFAGLLRDVSIRSLLPVLLALVAGGLLLLALQRNPLDFYLNVWRDGIEGGSWQDSAIRMAPLLLIAAGLTVIFRANIWNLGYDGQFLLATAFVSGYGPSLMNHLPKTFAIIILFGIAAVAGAAWTLIPAILKARYGTNEIITTLMMSFIGIDLANILIKGPFQDPTVNIAETRVLPFDKMLPSIPGTRVHVGLIVAGVAILAVHYLLTRTSFGLRLQILGANPRAAKHMGVNVTKVIVISFLISGALIGMAAAADTLGLDGFARANQNPGYGDTVIPFVFLARLNALAVIPFIAFFSVLSTGGDLAASESNLPTDFLLVLVALILLFMTIIEFLGRRRDLGTSYLTKGLRKSARS